MHIAARILGQADAGEIVVSRTVRDLVVGSGTSFEDRGSVELRGVPGSWQLLAVHRQGMGADSAEAILASTPTPGPRAAMRRTDRAVEVMAKRTPWILRGISRLTPATGRGPRLVRSALTRSVDAECAWKWCSIVSSMSPIDLGWCDDPEYAVQWGLGRGRRGRPKLLAVTLRLLQEEGYDGLTVDAVAAGARASKATVYRRWPTKAELVLAAFIEGVRQFAVAPETGTLRGDLLQLGEVICDQARTHASTMRAVLAVLTTDVR